LLRQLIIENAASILLSVTLETAMFNIQPVTTFYCRSNSCIFSGTKNNQIRAIMNLNHSVVIVTGAGSSVGRALALEFAAQGARVVCAARGVALPVATDVTDRAHVERMIENC
jgi:hypothetical protein